MGQTHPHDIKFPKTLTDPATSINHRNPEFNVDLQMRYLDGRWQIRRHAAGAGAGTTFKDITMATAGFIAEAAGTIKPEVIVKNQLGWDRAKIAFVEEQAAKLRREAEYLDAAIEDLKKEVE